MNQSESNNSIGSQLSDVPAIRGFEFDDKAIGEIKTNVNQFRGSASIPISFVTLPGASGLDVKISAMYSSNVRNTVANWNVTAPTGVLGMGWQMPFDQIIVNKALSNSSVSDEFYLVSSGSGNPLVKTQDTADGQWSFEARDYQFWDIWYDPQNETWTIRHEDGFIYTYGGKDTPGAVRWGVHWGNWIGSTNRIDGQAQYAAGWNLVSIQSPAGNKISYEYTQVMVAVGAAGGKTVTQACYLNKIYDSYNRTVTFNYKEKYGAGNPSSKGIVEYQARNAQKPEPNAYQNVYETRYLDSIDVDNEDGLRLFRLNFIYDFINLTATSVSNYGLFWKRILKSVWREAPSLASLPGMDFTYYDSITDVNPGAIHSITYPQGALARLTYKNVFFQPTNQTTVANPLSQGIPGVWHGTDYVVLTFCSPTKGIKVLVCSWNGRWLTVDVTASTMPAATVDPATIVVAARENYFVVFFRNTQQSRDEMYIYGRNPATFGHWTPYTINIQGLQLKTASAPASQIAAGNDFVVVYNLQYNANVFVGFSYDWRNDSWTSAPGMLPSPTVANGASGVSIAAAGNYYAVFGYFDSQQKGAFQLLYRQLQGTWQSPGVWYNTSLKMVVDQGSLLYTWRLASSFAVGTYVTAVSGTSINYSLRIFDFNEQFSVINSNNPVVANLTTPVVDSKPKYDLLNTSVQESFVSNTYANLRNVGGTPGVNNWMQQSISVPTTAKAVQFAGGADVAILSADGQNHLLTFNPDNMNWPPQTIAQGATNPTISGDYCTIGPYIYFKGVTANWQPLPVQLSGLGLPESVQNRAPNYIAYQSNGSASALTYVVIVRNGQASPAAALAGFQKLYVPSDQKLPGTFLAGPRFLVTYPAGQEFRSASTLNLYQFSSGNIGQPASDSPVAYIEIEDAYDPANSYVGSFFYANSDTAPIGYNPATGLAQYPLVSSVPGVRSLDSDPPSQRPYGQTQSFYSNGLISQSGVPGSIVNFDNILNGCLLAQRQYDSAGLLVGSQDNYWSVSRQNAQTGNRLFGGYARIIQQNMMQDGVTTSTTGSYYADSGLISSSRTSYYDSQGQAKRICTDTVYAYTKYAAMQKSHQLNAIAQQTKSVIDSGGKVVAYIQSNATSYKNWNEGGNTYWDVFETYRWIAPSNNAPSFDFSSSTHPDWLLTSRIDTRQMPSGVVTEQSDVNGTRQSFLYDRLARYQVASFPNASVQGNEASYYSFENYEFPQGWSLGNGAAIIPDSNFPTTDAHTGSKSLKLAPGTVGANGIQNSFVPQRSNLDYVFSAWVKKPSDFDASRGKAHWTIEVSGAVVKTIRVDFPDVLGKWVYVAALIPLADATSGGVTLKISAMNANRASYVLVDNLRFAPVSCIVSARSFNTRFWLPHAVLGANGECSRTVYGEFEQTVATTNSADCASSIALRYLSRKGNQGKFSPADPNLTLSILFAGGGNVINFSAGSEWKSIWQAGTGDTWNTLDGRVLSGSGTLTLRAPVDAEAGYAVRLQFAPLGGVTKQLGIRGGVWAIIWDPATGQWQFVTQDNQPAIFRGKDFKLPLGSEQSMLNEGRISSRLRELFRNHGQALPASAIAARQRGSAWLISSPPFPWMHHLQMEDSSLDVTHVPGDLLLIIAGKVLLFYAGGQRIFSYVASDILAGTPQLFFGDPVGIAGLMNGVQPQIAATFSDAAGNKRQSQSLLGEQTVMAQTLTDSMGNQAVNTKAAYVTPVSDFPLLAYREDFAGFNWSSGGMTGIINTAYPEDQGYPYTRQVYESSPLARPVERGLPGKDFAVGKHSTKFLYGHNDQSSGLPAGQYFERTIVDPNGDQVSELATSLQQSIIKVSVKKTDQGDVKIKNATVFDDFGFPQELRSPNYFDPPANSTSQNWTIQQRFNYAGAVVQVTQQGQNGPVVSNVIYDNAGNVRFLQDPQGQLDKNYNYFKYDNLGRLLESGYLNGTWDGPVLEGLAATDPAWPPTPPTWRKKFIFDAIPGSSQLAIGHILQAHTNNGTTGVADVIESYTYDVSGNRITASQSAQGFQSGLAYVFTYDYDELGNITQISYPPDPQNDALRIEYTRNQLNQITSIAASDDPSHPICSYTYEPNGRPASQILDPLGARPVTGIFELTSPLWIKSITYKKVDASTIFQEVVDYTKGGIGDKGYFNGQIANTVYQGGSGTAQNSQLAYAYNSLGALNAVDSPHPDYKIGLLDYDPNGNVRSFEQAGINKKYEYYTATQQVKIVTDTGSGKVLSSYQYDQNGNAIQSKQVQTAWTQEHQLMIAYDPYFKMAKSIQDTAAAQKDLAFIYGSNNQRILRTIAAAGASSTKLYLYGTNRYPLVENTLISSANVPVMTRYIFGPGGLLAMQKGGVRYGVLKDHLGSTRSVVDNNGSAVAAYDYLSFGTVAMRSEPSPGFMTYLYTGQEFDQEIDLYNYRARFYDSNLGRFIAIDPSKQFFSPYLYASNNPVLYIDPTGQFSIRSFFSALAGLFIGAVEILIGVAIDIVAAVLEVVTGGLSTPVSLALAAAAGAFYGAGASAVLYSAFNFNDFDWRDYGIEMGIGAATGLITAGFGTAGGIAAEAATGVAKAAEAGIAVSTGAKVAKFSIEAGFTVVGGASAAVVRTSIRDAAAGTTPGADVIQALYWGVITSFASKLLPGVEYKSGWGEYGKRMVAGVASSLVVWVPTTVIQNVTSGNDWDAGLVNTVVSSAFWGSLGALQVNDAAKEMTKGFLQSMAIAV